MLQARPFDAQFLRMVQPYGRNGRWENGAPVWETFRVVDVAAGAYPGHNGVDVPTADRSPLYACGNGIAHLFWDWTIPGKPTGWAIVINHDDGTSSLYGHVSKMTVSEGQRVKAGDVIAYSGGAGEMGSGFSSGAHLHFERHNGGSHGPTFDPWPELIAVFGSPQSQPPGEDVMTSAQSSAVATALIRSLQHLGVNVGSPSDEPNAAGDLAHALEAGDGGTVVRIMDGATFNRRSHAMATAIVRSLQRFGVDIGSASDQPNATADLAAALEASDSTAVQRIIDGATFNRRSHATATAVIRSLQHLGVDIGSAGDQPNATADLATALEASDSTAVERIMDGAKFPAHG